MAVLTPDCVSVAACDDCDRTRVLGTERQITLMRVTVLEGCDDCAGSTMVLQS